MLRTLGLEPYLRRVAFQPRYARNREWRTGTLTNQYPLGKDAEVSLGSGWPLDMDTFEMTLNVAKVELGG